MLGNFHQLAPAMAGVMGVATVLADTGYLERSGPLPLRFREPSAPIVRHIDAAFPPPFLPPYFPPPNMITMPTTVTPSASPDTSQATNDPPAPIALTNEPPSEFVAKQLVDDPGVAIGADGVVSPRMLLKYFAKSTNGAPKGVRNPGTLGVIAPLGFTPPTESTLPATPTPSPMAPPPGKAAPPVAH